MRLFLVIIFLFFGISCNIKKDVQTITLTEKNTMYLLGTVTIDLVSILENKFLDLCKKSDDKILYLAINTFGGEVGSLEHFIDIVKSSDCKLHTITQLSISSGYNLVQSLDNRYILSYGTMVTHSMYKIDNKNISNKFSSINIFNESSDLTIYNRVANRIKMPLTEYIKMIREDIYLTKDQSLKDNHADMEVMVKCDQSLEGFIKYPFFSENEITGEEEVKLILIRKCPTLNMPINLITNGKYNGR